MGVGRPGSAAAEAHVEDVHVPGIRQQVAGAQRAEQVAELGTGVERIVSPQQGIRRHAPAADAVVRGPGDQARDTGAVPPGGVVVERVGGVHAQRPTEFRVRADVQRVEVERSTGLDAVLEIRMTDFHAGIDHRHLHAGAGGAVVEDVVHLQVFPRHAAGLGVTGLAGIVQVPLLGKQRVRHARCSAPPRLDAHVLDAIQAVQGESGIGCRQEFRLLRAIRHVLHHRLEVVRPAGFQRAGGKREIDPERRSLAVDGRDIGAGLALDHASPVVRVGRVFVRNQRKEGCVECGGLGAREAPVAHGDLHGKVAR